MAKISGFRVRIRVRVSVRAKRLRFWFGLWDLGHSVRVRRLCFSGSFNMYFGLCLSNS